MISVQHRTRLEFGHALAQWAADQSGARMLHIKGLPAHLVLPVGGLASSDVDVLVEPTAHAAVLDCLLSRTTVKLNSDGTFCAEGHAVEVISDGFNVALDVHAHFPGCRAPATVVFDELWSDGSDVELAGWACRVPDRVGTAFVSVVHAARNGIDSKSRARALAHWDALMPEERLRFDGLVRRLSAEAAAHLVLGGYPDADRREVAKLRAYQDGARPATLWILTLLAERTGEGRLAVARRAARSRIRPVPAAAHYARVESRWARTKRAIGTLPSAVREAAALLGARNG